jgi:hypothetical protein
VTAIISFKFGFCGRIVVLKLDFIQSFDAFGWLQVQVGKRLLRSSKNLGCSRNHIEGLRMIFNGILSHVSLLRVECDEA